MIARAKGNHFLVYHGAENVVFDQRPERQPASARQRKRASSDAA
jgi:hypothetical protein